MSNTSRFRNVLEQTFDSQRLGVLSTETDGKPYASLVGFAVSHDLCSLFFVTTRATRKYANLRKQPHCAMLIDTRNNMDRDFHKAVAVTACGHATEIDKDSKIDALDLFVSRHPHIEQFARAPTSALMRIEVDKYYLVERFQNVTEIDPSQWR